MLEAAGGGCPGPGEGQQPEKGLDDCLSLNPDSYS